MNTISGSSSPYFPTSKAKNPLKTTPNPRSDDGPQTKRQKLDGTPAPNIYASSRFVLSTRNGTGRGQAAAHVDLTQDSHSQSQNDLYEIPSDLPVVENQGQAIVSEFRNVTNKTGPTSSGGRLRRKPSTRGLHQLNTYNGTKEDESEDVITVPEDDDELNAGVDDLPIPPQPRRSRVARQTKYSSFQPESKTAQSLKRSRRTAIDDDEDELAEMFPSKKPGWAVPSRDTNFSSLRSETQSSSKQPSRGDIPHTRFRPKADPGHTDPKMISILRAASHKDIFVHGSDPRYPECFLSPNASGTLEPVDKHGNVLPLNWLRVTLIGGKKLDHAVTRSQYIIWSRASGQGIGSKLALEFKDTDAAYWFFQWTNQVVHTVDHSEDEDKL